MIADQYLDALRPPKPPSPKRPQPERAPEEWEKDKQELRELEYHKYMLRTQDFPPYFLTEQGIFFLAVTLSGKEISGESDENFEG